VETDFNANISSLSALEIVPPALQITPPPQEMVPPALETIALRWKR
jgi:hypothetical protein